MLSTLRRTTIRTAVTLVMALAITTGAAATRTAKAEAFSAVTEATIGCDAGLLQITGRTVTGTERHAEQLYSLFLIYKWDGQKWAHVQTTDWKSLRVTTTSMAGNGHNAILGDGYFTAYEVLAWHDGNEWQMNYELTKLRPNLASLGTYYGSGFYARCR